MRFNRQQPNEKNCAVVTLKNCLLYKGYNYSLKELKKITHTDKDGTFFETDLFKGIKKLNYKPKHFLIYTKEKFKREINNELQNKKTIILTTDADYHVVAVLNREKNKYTIVDSMFDKLVQELTFNQLENLSKYFNREKMKSQHQFISF